MLVFTLIVSNQVLQLNFCLCTLYTAYCLLQHYEDKQANVTASSRQESARKIAALIVLLLTSQMLRHAHDELCQTVIKIEPFFSIFLSDRNRLDIFMYL